jgi:hypothetical protein
MTESSNTVLYSRGDFLRLCAQGVGGVAAMGAIPGNLKALSMTASDAGNVSNDQPIGRDLREFVHWILDDFEPSIRLPGGAGRYPRQLGQTVPALYGVADMACILYTINALHPSAAARAEWAATFELFQNPDNGWFREKEPATLSPQHNTAFALAAMQLLDLKPKFPVKMDAEYAHIATYLNSLDWQTGVYSGSHKGAGVGSIYVLIPELHSTSWFASYFSTCDSLFDSNNGMMGRGKPASGDIDQIGGTFHYSFLYEFFNRQIPYPERRIDSVLGLQRPDGYWSPSNHLWMTLDAIYLMTRTLRYCPHRFEDVRRSIRRSVKVLDQDVFGPEGRKTTFAKSDGVHSLTAAISIAAEAQQFLGSDEVITDWPLKLVLDRRPFI